MPDRSYYRLEGDKRLIEDAKYNPSRELAIALGERLEDVLAEFDEKVGEQKDRAADAERDASKLEYKIEEMDGIIAKLEMALDYRDNRIAELEAQLKKGN